jgi:hypothetical protein
MLIFRFSTERNPADISLLVLTTVHTYFNFIFKPTEISFWFRIQAIHIVDVVPKEMLLFDVIVKILIRLLELK